MANMVVTLPDGTVPNKQPNNQTTTTTMTTKSKAYSSASNAKRAAKSAGLDPATVLISSDAYGYYYETPAAKKAPAKKATSKAPKPVATTKLIDEATTDNAGRVTKKKVAVTVKSDAPVEHVGEVGIPMLRKSLVKHPVHAVWDMFDQLRAVHVEQNGQPIRRKDAIAHAVANGVAFYTARTQYQSWKTANKY